MQEARPILVDLNACAVQLLIIRACDAVDQLFVWDTRCDDAHIDARLRSDGQRGNHLVIQNQIGGCDIDVPLGAIDDVHEHGLTDVAVVKWTVIERLHIAVTRAHDGRHIAGTIQEAVFGRVLPHLQEHLGHVGDTRAHQTDTGVLPMAKAYALIDILIGQVDAAHEADVTVHNADFTVVTVVKIRVQGGNKAIEAHSVQP